MRILFLTSSSPWPPFGGAQVRVWSLLEALSAEHTVDLLSFEDSGGSGGAPGAELRRVCRWVKLVPAPQFRSRAGRLAAYVRGQISSVPWMVQEWQSREMEAAVARRSREVDAVVAVLLGMTRFLDGVTGGVLRVYDAHNVEASILEQVAARSRQPLRRLHAGREAVRVARYEAAVCRSADRVLAVTAEDRRALSLSAPKASIHTVPISIVAEDYPDLWRSGEPRICFFGDMAWLPNVEAAVFLRETILPDLRARLGGQACPVVLAGRRPAPAVRALEGPGVEVTGFVPKMEDVLAGDTIVVVPLLTGGGMRVKILEAMAWGLPVVSTPVGCAGIDHGGALLEAETGGEMAQLLAQLLTDPEQRRELGRRGRRRVAQIYGHRAVARQFLSALGP